MDNETQGLALNPGIYNVEYFSGAQCAVYIGDVWVDEITTISFAVHQSRSPIYGYASTYFDDMSKGHVLVQGEFSINFKEAGYLYLILNRYLNVMRGQNKTYGPFSADSRINTSQVSRRNIEKVINNEVSTFDRFRMLQQLAHDSETPESALVLESDLLEAERGLGGYASVERSRGGVGKAEGDFEKFEDLIWGSTNKDLEHNRRADEPQLNPFDIYLAFGDFANDNSVNHTIQKITNVHILGSSKRIVADGQPVQEVYNFIARNIV